MFLRHFRAGLVRDAFVKIGIEALALRLDLLEAMVSVVFEPALARGSYRQQCL